jgi:Glycosyltransferase family 87
VSRQQRSVSLPWLVTSMCWASAGMLWLFFVATQQSRPLPGTWLLDWHVYAAGARDFVDGTLYWVPLQSAHHLPIDQFNYPPLSAILAIPFLPLPDAVAGTLFVALNLVAMAGVSVIAAKAVGARHPALWGGIGFLAYTIHPWMRLAFLGNNTPLVLLLVVAFAHEHLRGRNRTAGALLGAAIALKLWPATLVFLLLRERRWSSIGTALAVVGLVALISLTWLGFGVMGPAAEAMQATAVVEPGNPVFYVSWLRETQGWWPWWGGYAVALILAAIPARGLVGIGLGIFAGLAAVPNLWRTYLPTLVVGGLFVLRGLGQRRGSVTGQARSKMSMRDLPGLAGPDSAG